MVKDEEMSVPTDSPLGDASGEQTLTLIVSEELLLTRAEMLGQLLLKSVRVGSHEREIQKYWIEGRLERTDVVLQDVEDEGSESEVSNGDLVVNEEHLAGAVQLLLADGQEVPKDSISDLLRFGVLLLFWHEEDLGDGVESVVVAVKHHVHDPRRLPVSGVVVSMLDAKGAQNSIRLLAALVSHMDDRKTSHLADLPLSFPGSPCVLRHRDELVLGRLVLEQLDKWVRPAVPDIEVLNLDPLIFLCEASVGVCVWPINRARVVAAGSSHLFTVFVRNK